MMNISLDTSKAVQFLNAGAVEAYESKVKEAQNALENATCAGNCSIIFVYSSVRSAF